jgi:hypothetical protein
LEFSSPTEQGIVVAIAGKVAEPLGAFTRENHGYVRNVARAETAGDGQLDGSVQLLRFPNGFDSLDRHFRQAALGLAAAAALTEKDLGG